MKIMVCMKCPDALEDAINDMVDNEHEAKAARKLAKKWFEYGEYLYVTIDTNEETCTVETT